MRRFGLLLSVVAVLLFGVFTGMGKGATAQEATPDTTAMMAMATHPVVGGWRLTNSSFTGDDDSFPSVAVFHADGTYTEVLPWGAVLVGVWEPTGEHTANLLFLLNDIIDDKIVQGEGRTRLEVDEAGNTMSLIGNFISLYEDGTVDMAVESPSTATRLEALPMEPLGTPVLPPDLVEATPTP
jgi:hypothetical protein